MMQQLAGRGDRQAWLWNIHDGLRRIGGGSEKSWILWAAEYLEKYLDPTLAQGVIRKLFLFSPYFLLIVALLALNLYIMRSVIESRLSSNWKVTWAIFLVAAFLPLTTLAVIFFGFAAGMIWGYFALLSRLESRYGR